MGMEQVMTKSSIIDAMDIEFEDGDIGTTTIRDYMKSLLSALIQEGEGFSGKRPFGNSGWEGFAVEPLIKSGLLTAEKNKWGEWDYDNGQYYDLLYAAIEQL